MYAICIGDGELETFLADSQELAESIVRAQAHRGLSVHVYVVPRGKDYKNDSVALLTYDGAIGELVFRWIRGWRVRSLSASLCEE